MKTIVVGPFGSGKTEFAVNYAINKAKEKQVALVDLDYVNPYFRSREVVEVLKKHNVKLIAPNDKQLRASELPALPPDVIRYLNSDVEMVFDVGGGKLGATVLGRFKEVKNREVLFVVNPYRPYADTIEKVKDEIAKIEEVSNMKIDALILNPNLGVETDKEVILKGIEKLKDLKVKVKYVMVEEKFEDKLDIDLPLFFIKRYQLLPHERNDNTSPFKVMI